MPAQGFDTSAIGFPKMSPIYGPVVNGEPYRPRGWDGVGIAPVVPGTSGLYLPQRGGYSWYPPTSPSLGYARPSYTVGGSFNVGGGVLIGVGVGASRHGTYVCPAAACDALWHPQWHHDRLLKLDLHGLGGSMSLRTGFVDVFSPGKCHRHAALAADVWFAEETHLRIRFR